MRDTSPEMEARHRALLMARSPEERAAMASDMSDAAREMARSGIRARMGELDEVEMRVQLFLHLYGRELGPDRCARVVARIRSTRP